MAVVAKVAVMAKKNKESTIANKDFSDKNVRKKIGEGLGLGGTEAGVENLSFCWLWQFCKFF